MSELTFVTWLVLAYIPVKFIWCPQAEVSNKIPNDEEKTDFFSYFSLLNEFYLGFMTLNGFSLGISWRETIIL